MCKETEIKLLHIAILLELATVSLTMTNNLSMTHTFITTCCVLTSLSLSFCIRSLASSFLVSLGFCFVLVSKMSIHIFVTKIPKLKFKNYSPAWLWLKFIILAFCNIFFFFVLQPIFFSSICHRVLHFLYTIIRVQILALYATHLTVSICDFSFPLPFCFSFCFIACFFILYYSAFYIKHPQ